ncbi:hypothetical protein EV363DRAFT_1454330 [Boletus edulis]|nr:hypothetical protein EV363DRAFT_1454330 [Boletus edulis]
MDPILANSILANVDCNIFQIFQTFIPLHSLSAWTHAQEQVENQLSIASNAIDSATNVPDLVVATKMFWRSKGEGWPDLRQIIECPAELLRAHPWYRSTSSLPCINAAFYPLPANNDTATPIDVTDVRDAQVSRTSADGGNEEDEVCLRGEKRKGKQREDFVIMPRQDTDKLHAFEQTITTNSPTVSPPDLRVPEEQDAAMDQSDGVFHGEDELGEEPERGRSASRRTSTANRRGRARSRSWGRRGISPACSSGSQIPRAMSNCECSLFHSASCIQRKSRRKRYDFAGPRGPPRTRSHILSRQRSLSSAPSPQSKQAGVQSRAHRPFSPTQVCSSQQRNGSPTPGPTTHKMESSRVSREREARPMAEDSEPPAAQPAIVIPPLGKRVIATSSGAPGGVSEERPIRPLPTRGRPPGSSNRTTGPAELGITMGATYTLQAEPLVTRQEHLELGRQLATMKAENDWIMSELKKASALIGNMQSIIPSLQGTAEATRQFSAGSGNRHTEQSFRPLNISAGRSRGAAPHLPSPFDVARPKVGERDFIPPIKTLAVRNSEAADRVNHF